MSTPKLAQEKNVVRLTDHLNMTIAVDCDIIITKKQNKTCRITISVSMRNCQKII